MQITNLYLLRHGRLESDDVLAGHTDFLLSKPGLAQMFESVSELDVDICLSSPLRRCRLFAEQYARQSQSPLFIEEAIQEMNFGDWDGKSFESLWQMPKPNIGDFWQNPIEYTPPGGESFGQFDARVRGWWQAFLAEAKPQRYLVVTHAGVIKHLISLVLGEEVGFKLQSKVAVGYGTLVHIQISSDEAHAPWPVVHL